MSGRPFLSHTDAPTPHTFSRPAFVPALKFGGGLGFGPGNSVGRGSSSVAAPARPAPSVSSSAAPAAAHVAVARPAAAAPFGGGGGGGGGGGARAAFKPSGATDSSNLYIYRAPTNLGYRGPGASPPPPAASPPPASSAGGIARGPPSATDSKMLGGAGRDYKFPSKAEYTPYGPKNAPYAQAPAGGRPVTNAFRQPTLQPHMKSTRSQPRRPSQRHPADVVSGKAPPAASKSPKTPEDDEPWDPDADSADDEDDDEGVRHRTGGAVPRRVKPARPSSAFRGASPRQAPPEAFQPVVEEITLAMTVTNGKPPRKKRLPGTGSSATSKAANQAASKSASVAPSQAGSVAGTDRSSKKPSAEPVDPDDPFADYAAADAVANDSPRSHTSHRSHVSARSSTSTQHSAGWYTRNFHYSGDPVKDLAMLSEKAKALQKQVDAQRKAEARAGDGDGEEKDGSGQQGAGEEEEEEETFAEDHGGDAEEQAEAGEEEPLDDEAQQQADEDAAEANEQQQQEQDEDAEQQRGPGPDDDEVLSGQDDADRESKDESAPAPAPAPAAVDPAPVRKLRPAGKLNVWAAAEPLTTIPHLYTPSQWGAQTRAEQGAGLGRTLPLGSTLGSTLAGRSLAPVRAHANGNETSDIDTENDTGLSADEDSHDDAHAAEARHAQQENAGSEDEESKHEQRSTAKDLEQQAKEEAAALAADASASPEPSGGDDDDFGGRAAEDEDDVDRDAEALNDEDEDDDAAGGGSFDGTITALHSFPVAAAAAVDPDAGAYSDSDPFAEHAEQNNMMATTSTFLVQQAPLSRTSKGATLRKSGAPPMPVAAPVSAVPAAAAPASAAVAATAPSAAASPPSGLLTDDSDDEGVHALLSSSNSSKSLFANIMQVANKAAAAAAVPTVKPPPAKRVVSTAELLLSPPLSPSTSSVAPTPTAAAASASSSSSDAAAAAAAPPAHVDYMSVLKRKGVLAPATEAQKAERREDALSLKDAAAQRERLRVQEQLLLERKWKQIQAEEQAMGSASEGEGGFGEDNTLPSVRSTARQEADTSRSNKSAKSSANSSRASSHKSTAAAAAAAATASTSASSAASSARSHKASAVAPSNAKAPTPLKSKVPAAWSNAPPATGAHSPIAAPFAAIITKPHRPASSSGVRMSRAPPAPAPAVRTPSPAAAADDDTNAATAAFAVHHPSGPFGATGLGAALGAEDFGEEAEIPSSDAVDAEESMMRLEEQHDDDDAPAGPAAAGGGAAFDHSSFSDDPFDSSFTASAHTHRSEIPQSPAAADRDGEHEEEDPVASPLSSPKPHHLASDAEADPAEASFAASEDDPFASM